MDIDAYLIATDATALYREAGSGSELALAYVALGLMGESSELLEKSMAGDAAGVVAEAGDVLWYVARVHRECSISTAETFGRAAGPASGGAAADVVIAAGRLAELVKKMIRDDAGHLSAARREAIVGALGRVASAWLAFNAATGLDPDATARANVAKLLDRKRREVLSGSGDDR